jgi:hypothetical protein
MAMELFIYEEVLITVVFGGLMVRKRRYLGFHR